MIIKGRKDLSGERDKAKAKVSKRCEEIIAALSHGHLHDRIHDMKLKEAVIVLRNGPSVENTPMIMMEASLRAASPEEVAQSIIAKRKQADAKIMEIEARRIKTNMEIDRSNDTREIATIASSF